MTVQGLAVFATAIGHCGIAWSEAGIVGCQLPEGSQRRARERLLDRYPDVPEPAPPPEVTTAIDGIVALLRGEQRDLTAVPVALEGVPDFHRRAYDLIRTIRPGRTMTYGEVARELGAPGSARAVGHAMGSNPVPIVVPCHRVVAADGRPGGFSAHGGVTTKLRILQIEGALEPGLFDL
jgi:methylated-DNA-[protein]-cysteine S-methyltransferase